MMRYVILLLSAGMLSACSSTGAYQESTAQWDSMDYAAMDSTSGQGIYMSISPGMSMK
jgi:hypothetical protein